jgi:hypothetical protein
MANTDRAIVVGISCYPGPDFGDLGGPENDAKAFYELLVSSDGGAIPKENVELILSSDYKLPFGSPSDALPTLSEIQRAIDRLQYRAKEQARQGSGYKIGRRFYIYMSGHGFAPSEDEAAVFMANVTRECARYHILRRYNADWFYKPACFDEILLLRDSCRQHDPLAPLNRPYLEVMSPQMDRVKCVYGFGPNGPRMQGKGPS